LVGKTPEVLMMDLECCGRKFQSRVVRALSAFLLAKTGLKNWPWSKCDNTLAEAGYELKLLPGSRSDINTFKTSSNSLNQAKLVAMDKDLKEHLIQLVPIQRSEENQVRSQTQGSNNQPNISLNRNRALNTSNFSQSNPIINTQPPPSFNRVNTNIIEPRILDPALLGIM
ncbi:hypothetical protein DFH28DRAFT_883738, partial [Melampsora americana]